MPCARCPSRSPLSAGPRGRFERALPPGARPRGGASASGPCERCRNQAWRTASIHFSAPARPRWRLRTESLAFEDVRLSRRRLRRNTLPLRRCAGRTVRRTRPRSRAGGRLRRGAAPGGHRSPAARGRGRPAPGRALRLVKPRRRPARPRVWCVACAPTTAPGNRALR